MSLGRFIDRASAVEILEASLIVAFDLDPAALCFRIRARAV